MVFILQIIQIIKVHKQIMYGLMDIMLIQVELGKMITRMDFKHHGLSGLKIIQNKLVYKIIYKKLVFMM